MIETAIGSEDLRDIIIGKVSGFATMKPEPWEDWESWYIAAFDMLHSEICDIEIDDVSTETGTLTDPPERVRRSTKRSAEMTTAKKRLRIRQKLSRQIATVSQANVLGLRADQLSTLGQIVVDNWPAIEAALDQSEPRP